MRDGDPTASKEWYLRESRLFAGLPRADIKDIERRTTMTTCRRGRVFFSPQNAAGTVYVLKKGRVRLYRKDRQGRALTTAVLDPGAVFGESALLGQTHPEVYAEALDDGLVCVIPGAELRALVRRFPQLGLNLIEFLGERLMRTQELSEEMAYWSAARRLAHQLLLLKDRYGRTSLTGGSILAEVFTPSGLAEDRRDATDGVRADDRTDRSRGGRRPPPPHRDSRRARAAPARRARLSGVAACAPQAATHAGYGSSDGSPRHQARPAPSSRP